MLQKTNKRDDDMMTPQDAPFLIRSQTVVSRMVAGETLIVPVRGKVGDLASIYSFNESGSLIWKLLENPRTLSDVVAAVAQEYDVDTQQAERDVRQFVDEMMAAGLVEVPSVVAMTGTEGPVGREGLATAGAR
jgi:hypothetical protein